MTSADLVALSPLIALALTAALIMLQIAVRRHHGAVMGLSLAGLAAAVAALFAVVRWSLGPVTPLLVMDTHALFFMGLILLTTAGTVMLAYGYLRQSAGQREEFYLLLILATLGAAVMAASRHFAAFFIGLEILSIALYALIAYYRRRPACLEAGLKYLVLAAAASAFLLFGMALIYLDTGSLDFTAFTAAVARGADAPGALFLLAGTGMLVVGFGFKLALFPFHMWTPDVYQGAPAPISGFVATVSKTALVAVLVRLFAPVALAGNAPIFHVFGLLAVGSMVAGNLLALAQNSVKRILAYSSIAHMGYILVAFMAGGRMAVQAVAFYMTAYSITALGAFGIVAVFSGRQADADRLTDFQGMAFRHPWLGGLFTAMLLSLAGIPLTAGFIGKFYLVAAGLHSALAWLVIVLLLTSGMSLFYYLRIVVTLFSQPAERQADSLHFPAVGVPGGLAIAAVAVLLFWLGIAPGPLLSLLIGVAG